MAQQRSQLPTFGNWENGDSVHYTAYFERARKGKGHAKRNPDGAQSDNETYVTSEPSTKTSSIQKEVDLGSQKVAEPEAAMSKHKHYRSGYEADRKRLIGSPLHRGATGGRTASSASRPYSSGVRKPQSEAEQVMKGQTARRPSHEYRIRVEEDGHRRRRFSDSTLHRDPRYGRVAAESPVHHDGGMISRSTPNRLVWQNPWVEHIESSTHRTQHLASVGGGGGRMSTPVREKRYSFTCSGHSAAPMTPGRSRLKSVTRGDKTPNHITAVPKFGDWDETNPSSADVYTDVFDRVVEEKKGAARTAPVTTTEAPRSIRQHSSVDTRSESQGCWCFPWRGK
ncbi:RPM1-interacting protein 4-like isoform X1 [Syzygium oleosum]|uniref:RPM1-interacting protein 4-like isoform X1 n=1 Tax=Syzygium oleosum TaxID=219896 RepID=UPI0011D197C1|nr:RPM1-interacting protein 4-like isoform X1 [Syzygium oleosum]